MKFNDNWRTELEQTNGDCMTRLAECRNKKYDILTIAKIMYKYNKDNFTKEACLVRTLEWIGDWNGQYDITDLSIIEYNRILAKI